MTEKLLASLDDAAIKLLERANSDDTNAASQMSLLDRVKVFEAVVKYSETRNRMKPAEPDAPRESDFDRLRSKLNGAGKRRAAAPKIDEAVELPSGDADAGGGPEGELSDRGPFDA